MSEQTQENRIDSAPLKALLDDHGWRYADCAEIIGVTTSTISTWLTQGHMPRYMEIICEALAKDKRHSHIVVSGREDKIALVENMASAMGVTTQRLRIPPFKR